MNREAMLADLKSRLGAMTVSWREKSAVRHYVEIRPETIRAATEIVFKTLGARLQTATGVDTPAAIEILYHWAFDAHGCVVTLVVKLSREKPSVDSIAVLCKGAEWIEREIWELLGVEFRTHPDMRHLLLSDDWPKGKYPLRRDYRR